MDIEKLVSLIFLASTLIAIVTLLFITVIPCAKEEIKERQVRIKMFKAITKYYDIMTDFYDK